MGNVRPDVAAARHRMRIRFGTARELRRLPRHLWADEWVDRMIAGSYGRGTGLVVLTDRRLIFLQDRLMSQASADIPLDRISSVQWQVSWALGSVVVFTSNNRAEIKQVNKADGTALVDVLRQRLSTPGPLATPASPAPSTAQASGPDPTADVLGWLRKLGELRDAGVVTPQEFEAKKTELLDRL